MLRSEELQNQLIEAQRAESRDQRTFIQEQLDYQRRLIIHYDETAQGETEAVERECGERIQRVQEFFGALKQNSETVIAELESRLRKLSGLSVPPLVSRQSAGDDSSGATARG